jgi:putative hemolysin
MVVVVILFLVALTAFYVAAEFAAVAVRTVRIQARAEAGNRTAKVLMPYLKDASALDRYVAACQIGITLSSLILGAYGQTNLTRFFQSVLQSQEWMPGHYAGPVALASVLLLLTGFHVVLGELLPKAIALRFPEQVALVLTYPMIASLWLYSLAIRFLNGTGTLILKAFGVPVHGHRHVHSPEELMQLVRRGEQSGTLPAEESRLLEKAFHFGERQAREVMVPRTQVVGLDLGAKSAADLLGQVCAAGRSRLPR